MIGNMSSPRTVWLAPTTGIDGPYYYCLLNTVDMHEPGIASLIIAGISYKYSISRHFHSNYIL